MPKCRRIPDTPFNELREAARTATMETAGFGFPNEYVQRVSKRPDGTFVPYGEPVHVTAFIVEETRLWRESWVLGPLRRLIAWAENERPLRDYWRD